MHLTFGFDNIRRFSSHFDSDWAQRFSGNWPMKQIKLR